MDASLPQEHGLSAGRKRVAYDLPFLEADGFTNWNLFSAQILSRDGALFPSTEDSSLENHTLGCRVEAVAVAVRADGCPAADDGVTALTNLVA